MAGLSSLSLTEAGRAYLAQRDVARGLDAKTIERYSFSIGSFLTTPGLPDTVDGWDEQLLQANWDDWLYAMRKRELKAGSIRNYQNDIMIWLRWLYRRRYLRERLFDFLDCIPVDDDQVERPTATTADMRWMLEAAANGLNQLRDTALLEIMWGSGIRRGEAAELSRRDIRLDFGSGNHLAMVERSKTGKRRAVPLSGRAALALRDYMANTSGRPADSLFGMTRAAISLLFKRLSRRASRGRAPEDALWVTPHQMRRATANTLSDNGMDIEDVRVILGHKDIRETAKYAHAGAARRALLSYRDTDKVRR